MSLWGHLNLSLIISYKQILRSEGSVGFEVLRVEQHYFIGTGVYFPKGEQSLAVFFLSN